MHDLGYIIDRFTNGYIKAALWSEVDGAHRPLSDQYTVGDIAPTALAKIAGECQRFQLDNADDLSEVQYRRRGRDVEALEEIAGHDFLLTRNGHGTGFGTRGFGKVGRRLTHAARDYGPMPFYVGDGGLIYVSGGRA